VLGRSLLELYRSVHCLIVEKHAQITLINAKVVKMTTLARALVARHPKIMLLAGAGDAVFVFAFRPIVADVSRRTCLSVMNRTDYGAANCPPLPSEFRDCPSHSGEFHEFPLYPTVTFVEASFLPTLSG